MTATNDNIEPEGDLDVAIVGIACRFPGAPDLAAFWELLRAGKEGIAFFTDEELAARGVPPSRRRTEGFVPAAPVIEDFDCFDAEFFGYSPADAALLDPQHRLFLQCAWHALENAGHGGGHGVGRVGVFAGTSLSTYLLFNLITRPEIAAADDTFPAMVANDKDFLSTRLSYHLGLQGPSLDIQTGCSTSLVATHIARQSLLTYQCDLALAGGVSIHMPQRTGYVHTPGGIGSVDGHCRAYDAAGSGTVFGSGVGVVALRRLSDALADGDPIFAILRGSAINNDGHRKVGFTAPSIDGQVEVIRHAMAVAGVEPGDIGFVEGHGTGTELGDPVEVAALNDAFGRGRGPGTCALGSVKSNLGHLDAAAGIAGLIKASLAVAYGVIPPTLHFERPNPKIPWSDGPFHVNAQAIAWPTDVPRIAGVSAFGIGGTNAHAIVEGPTERPVDATASDAPVLLLVSAKDEEVLRENAERLATHLETHPGLRLQDVAWTLQSGRVPMRHRQIVVAEQVASAAVRLRGEDRAGSRPKVAVGECGASPPTGVVFMFPGGGAQYVGMGKGLLEREPVFAQAFARCADWLTAHRGIDLLEETFPQGGDRELTRPSVALPALFAIEYSLAQLLIAKGLRPVAMAGHSMGEYVAACLAGVFSLEDAMALVCERGRLFETLENGGMLSLPLPETDAQRYVSSEVSIAAINGPRSCVLAGSKVAIDRLSARLESEEVEFRRIPIDVAAHSPMVEPILPAFRTFVRKLSFEAPEHPFVSGVSGTWATADQVTDPEYWVRHLRHTVRFHDVLSTLLEDRSTVLLEVGPGRTLSSAAIPCVESAERGRIASTMRSRRDDGDDVSELLMGVGRLWLAGLALDWSQFHADGHRRRVALPGYAFRRERHFVDAEATAMGPGRAKIPDPTAWRYAPSWRRSDRTSTASVLTEGDLVVFSDGDPAGIGEHLIARALERGVAVHRVEPGRQFAISQQGFSLPPGDRAAYDHLLDALGTRPRSVVYAWTAGAREPLTTNDAFFGPLYLAQALEERGDTPVSLLVVTRGLANVLGTEPIDPRRALALGPVRGVALESERIVPALVDLFDDHGDPILLAERVLGEVDVEHPGSIVALRGRHRFVETFDRRPPVAETERGWIVDGSIVLITGGLGDLGLVIAHDLAERHRVRVALVGRSAMPPRPEWANFCEEHDEDDLIVRKIRAIEAIEAAGGQVMTLSADVREAGAMARVVSEVTSRWGRIDGVIHAAGVPAGGPFALKTAEQCAPVLDTKVLGLQVLRDELAARGVRPRWWILFSSRTAVVGDLGQVDHCAANAYLDAVACSEARLGTRIVSIAWDTWRDIGQAVTAEVPAQLRAVRAEVLAHAMSTAEARSVWADVLRTEATQVIVSTQDLPTVFATHRAYVRAILARAAAAPKGRRSASGRYVAPRSPTEEAIAEVWSDVLGIAEIGIEDNFFDLGGNSLLALSVARAIRKRLDRDLSPAALFERPTVGALASLLDDEEQNTVVAIDDRRDRGTKRRERRKHARSRELG